MKEGLCIEGPIEELCRRVRESDSDSLLDLISQAAVVSREFGSCPIRIKGAGNVLLIGDDGGLVLNGEDRISANELQQMLERFDSENPGARVLNNLLDDAWRWCAGQAIDTVTVDFAYRR